MGTLTLPAPVEAGRGPAGCDRPGLAGEEAGRRCSCPCAVHADLFGCPPDGSLAGLLTRMRQASR